MIDSSRWNDEWLETDGLGAFASGTSSGVRTRRYHNLLMCATEPPAGRMVQVNGLDAWLDTPHGRVALSTQRYTPDVIHPDGHSRLVGYSSDPWPTWTFQIDDSVRIRQELLVPHGRSETVLRWTGVGCHGCRLHVRTLLSGRDYHTLHHENPAFNFKAVVGAGWVQWQPYAGVPTIHAMHNGEYESSVEWFRNFQYDEERARGLDFVEDLASPGAFTWDLSRGDAVLVLRAIGENEAEPQPNDVRAYADRVSQSEAQRRSSFASPLLRAADAYIVQRGAGQTIVAGYPWFTDWGRDTFIAMRGLCLSTGRYDAATRILLEWSDAISEGMLPNRFPDGGEAPEYNSVDASLWYVVAVHDLLAVDLEISGVRRAERRKLEKAVLAIVEGYAEWTPFGIRQDTDGLLAAGKPGVQLTWMDAKVGDWVVTPRIGKPVEVQALWINALRIAGQIQAKWSGVHRRSLSAFQQRFWRDDAGCLFDVIDVDDEWGKSDPSIRPNQIFAVGGLPFGTLPRTLATRVVDCVESRLLTPLGLRSLAPDEAAYRPHYSGGVWERDSAYHQGTVWPWLIGPFAEAWLRVRGNTARTRNEAKARFLTPILDHLSCAGIGHVSEIADADPPHTPRGCPFQAWSLGELLRVQTLLQPQSREVVTRRGRIASHVRTAQRNGRAAHSTISTK